MKDLKRQKLITGIRLAMEHYLMDYANLTRVTAPLFVKVGTGINDNLNGVERPVTFDIPSLNCKCEIVHSLAKWKRMALAEYNIAPGYGIYTNMNAIRRDEELDELHSIYVDQWDWEKVITTEDRNLDFLKNEVKKIYISIKSVYEMFADVRTSSVELPENISFVTTEYLCDKYPELTPKERELAYMKEDKSHYATFIIGIGNELSDGKKHDGRSPDYDDWSLNGDILVYDEENDRVIELSSMGIRVDKDSLVKQLKHEDCLDRLNFEFHKGIMNDTLPLSIGGGIGQSRLCMFCLGLKHIKDVQESIWE